MLLPGIVASSGAQGPSGPVRPSFRYYRLAIDARAANVGQTGAGGISGYTVVGELVLRSFSTEDAGFAIGGTVTSTSGNATDERAFDGDPATYWVTSINASGISPIVLQYDLGEGKSRPLVEYSIAPGDSNGDYSRAPGDFSIEGSNDGVDWTVLDYRAGLNTAYWTAIGFGNFATFTPADPGTVNANVLRSTVVRPPAPATNLRVERAKITVVRGL